MRAMGSKRGESDSFSYDGSSRWFSPVIFGDLCDDTLGRRGRLTIVDCLRFLGKCAQSTYLSSSVWELSEEFLWACQK